MKNLEKAGSSTAAEVRCDACDGAGVNGEQQFATLRAGFGSAQVGKRYELNLCKSCFAGTLAYIKQQRRVNFMFDDDYDSRDDDRLGIVEDSSSPSDC